MHLLDTETVWALRTTGGDDAAVAGWAEQQAQAGLFISALTLAELGAVAGQVDRTDKGAAASIRRWIDTRVAAAFERRILAVDAAVARRAATLAYPHPRDGLFAATALEHGLILATRTPAAFRVGKVRTIDPWHWSPRAEGDDGDWRQASRAAPVWIRNLFARG